MFVGVCVASTDAPETLTVPFILAVVSTFADKDVVSNNTGKNASRIFFIVSSRVNNYSLTRF